MKKASITKRAAPQPKLSTENKTFADPVDLLGTQKMAKRATSVRKRSAPPATPTPSGKGTYTGRVSTDGGKPYPPGTRGSDIAWSVPNNAAGAGTHRTSTVRVNQSGGRGTTARKAMSDTTAMPKNVMSPKNQTTGAEVLRHKAMAKGKISSYPIGQSGFDPKYKADGTLVMQQKMAKSGQKYEPKQPKSRTYGGTTGGPKNFKTKFHMKGEGMTKDITSAFVPSIGVKQGKKRDLQAPAKNLYPPAGKNK